MRALSRFFWTTLAVIFLIEAWLWSHLEPLVAAVVRAIPLARVKAAIAAGVNRLPPFLVLFVFLIPMAVLFPFKLAALWFLANGQIVLGVATFVLAKLVGVAVAAFLFETCKPKLMQMAWFARFYAWFVRVWTWAHGLVDPIKARIKGWMARLRGKARSGFARRFAWLRGRARRRDEAV
ncbi:hypothetical protein sos41_18720 [Alphaproteobacteria bacterium SO-S41]|nr:hypothetical protein sos41_18720 [Alphaproteobacteria bacterium SO-S41]